MKFVFERIESLPQMAWCLHLQAERGEIHVTHGAGVDCRGDFFFEGCWNGDLTAAGLLDADICAATGGCAQGDRLLLACPSNTLARLYGIRKGIDLWFSNSMAFAVEAAEDALQPDYLYYQDDISSVIDGLQESIKSIPLHSGARVDFYFHCNVEISTALRIQIKGKKQSPEFLDFSTYRGFLSKGLADLARNARDTNRTMRFKPLVSVSTGYDSVACAVLAKEAGCEDAVTMFDPESSAPNADNGSELARALGLNVQTFSRVEYKRLGGEWEFFALGTGGEDIFFSPMEDMFAGRMFISGFHGDKIWDKHPKKISEHIIRGDPSGADLEEFRLRVGFVHVAVPFFGCRAQSSIHQISNSAELREWSVGGDYDRPICRRIGEDAGLPRTGFGQKKRVMSRSFGTAGLAWYLGAKSLRDFREYTARTPQRCRSSDRLLHQLARWSAHLVAAAGRYSYRVGAALQKLTASMRRYQRPLDETRQLFHWSFEKMAHKYRSALAKHR